MQLTIEMDSSPPPILPQDEPENLATPPAEMAPVARPGFFTRLVRGVGSVTEWIFGAITLLVTLAVLAVVPVLNFLSLGYLLEASGRVARSGRLRDAFIGVRKAAIVGRMIAGTWLVLWPARFVSGMWQDSLLIAPHSGTTTAWRVGLIIISFITFGHIVWACLRGGKLRQFFWPAPFAFIKWLSAGNQFTAIQDKVLDYLTSLRLVHYLKLGAMGFAGAFVWLVVPVGILIIGAKLPLGGAALLGLLGGGLLAVVTLYLPFLQAHFAAENRFKAMFELRRVRTMFTQAPLAFWLALLITLLFALPLYLLKIEFPPKQIAWLPSLLFVLFIFPARMLTGWAVGRARKRETPRHWFWRWTARLGALPLALAYVLLVYLTQYLSWNGTFSLLEQHAFLVPAPMFSL